jgi:hypothetical protein
MLQHSEEIEHNLIRPTTVFGVLSRSQLHSPTQQKFWEPYDDQQSIATRRLSSHFYESKATNSSCTVGNVFTGTFKRAPAVS